MSKKILLIENDPAFAAEVSQSLERTGFAVRVTGDGKEGLDLAREWGPAAIVLCVELPGMSGYLVCQKLRKDDALKPIPLVLTSAEATADTFEKHKALKVRADAYHLKPYAPRALVETLGGLVGLPEESGDEELVSLEEEMGLEALPTEPEGELPELDLQSLPEEPAASAGDETLALLDDAFEGLTAPEPSHAEPPALVLDFEGETPVLGDEADAALSPFDSARPERRREAPESKSSGRTVSLDEPLPDAGRDPLALDDETEAALGALGADEPIAPPPDERLPGTELDLDRALEEMGPPGNDRLALDPAADLDRELEAVRPPVRGASADLLRAAGIKLLDDEATPPAAPVRGTAPAAAANGASERLERELADAQRALGEARAATSGRDGELRQARARAEEASRRADESTRRAEEAESALSAKDVELAASRAKGDAAVTQARKLEADLRASREEARRAAEQARTTGSELAALQEKLAATERRAEEAEVRAEEAAAEASRKGEELAALEAAAARTEELERQLDELRTELVVARGEAEGARGEIEKSGAELTTRVTELEAANAKHEERVLKAYQKIKNDEKVKDKVRKALAIAAQLLEEGLPPETAAEKERRAAAAAVLTRE